MKYDVIITIVHQTTKNFNIYLTKTLILNYKIVLMDVSSIFVFSQTNYKTKIKYFHIKSLWFLSYLRVKSPITEELIDDNIFESMTSGLFDFVLDFQNKI